MDEPTTPSTNPTPTPGGAPGSPAPGSAEALAAEALKAAQAAVSNLSGSGPNVGAPAPASATAAQAKSDEADAAMAAAMAAIQQAKSSNAIGAVGPGATGATPSPLNMPAFSTGGAAKKPEGMDLLSDVNLNVKIELGRTRMLVEDVLRLGEGSVVELDKLAGDPVDVYVNDRHVARGEVLVLNDNFCVRINEIVAQVTEAG